MKEKDREEEEDEEDEDGPLKCSPCRVRQEREEMQTAWSVSAPGFTSIGVRLKIAGVRGVGGGAAIRGLLPPSWTPYPGMG